MNDWKPVTVNDVTFKRLIIFGSSPDASCAVRGVPEMSRLFEASYAVSPSRRR
jgi:hypothetical protein